MVTHPDVLTLVERIRTDQIGGAADTAKEVVDALARLVGDSESRDAQALTAEVDEAVRDILRAMPSLAPAVNALHRFVGAMERAVADGASLDEMKRILQDARNDFFGWIETALQTVASYGAERVAEGDRVFTYSMSSTVWRIFRSAKEQGKNFEVVVTESRPDNEGLSTVNTMNQLGIRVSVGIDASVGELIPGCDACFVGADAVASTGHALCKAGTYPSALVAAAHRVPFYVAADTSKFDTATLLGLPYRNELVQRHHLLDDSFPPNVSVVGHLFDETPPELITAVITEVGLLHPAAAYSILKDMQPSTKLSAMLPSWSKGKL